MKKFLAMILGLSLLAFAVPTRYHINDVVIHRGDAVIVVTVPGAVFVESEICIGTQSEAHKGGISCHDAIPFPTPDGLR
jgi:hypothetical protein